MYCKLKIFSPLKKTHYFLQIFLKKKKKKKKTFRHPKSYTTNFTQIFQLLSSPPKKQKPR